MTTSSERLAEEIERTDSWTVLIKAGNQLAFAAQTAGGAAWCDEGLIAAIEEWARRRDAFLAVERIKRLEPEGTVIGAGVPDNLRSTPQAHAGDVREIRATAKRIVQRQYSSVVTDDMLNDERTFAGVLYKDIVEALRSTPQAHTGDVRAAADRIVTRLSDFFRAEHDDSIDGPSVVVEHSHAVHWLADELARLHSVPAVGAVSGWQLVPKEPTLEMLACFTGYTPRGLTEVPGLIQRLKSEWSAMLAAAPAPASAAGADHLLGLVLDALAPLAKLPIGPEVVADPDLVLYRNAGRSITVGDVLTARNAISAIDQPAPSTSMSEEESRG